MSRSTGVISMGVKAPIIREGDDLKQIVISSIMNALYDNGMKIQDGDVIGITESVVARAQGNYVTIDDIVEFLRSNNYKKRLELYCPIMSRNRFSMILKAFARYADKISIIIDGTEDEQGNPTFGVNPFTGINILEYYKEICESENCEFAINETFACEYSYIDCQCHPEISENTKYINRLSDIMTEPIKRADGTMSGYNTDWGLLGSNKANEETLKLFPRKDEAQALVDSIQEYFSNAYGKTVNVLVYGDGCFKSPEYQGVSIWEWADPDTVVAMTDGIVDFRTEVKVKFLADDKYKNLNGEELNEAINEEIINKKKESKDCMINQGTTPRKCKDLLASLMDLVSGSGDRCTPIVYIHGYFQ